MLVEVAVFTVNAVKGVFQLLKYVWTLIGDREIIIRGAKLIERNRLFRIPIAVDGDISIELALVKHLKGLVFGNRKLYQLRLHVVFLCPFEIEFFLNGILVNADFFCRSSACA